MGSSNATRDVEAVVIGSGFSGLYMCHSLRDRLGMDVQVFEAGSGVGGTWYWNRYPGARCDVEAYLYCFSFDKDLLQEWEWSGKFPEQPEILRYLNHVADRFDLRRSIQFDTRVTSARYDEAANRWTVETEQGDVVRAKYVIAGMGCLTAAQVPDIPGRESFGGQSYHTASWPHEGVDLTGKRVGVIGTGSSGIQSIPTIAKSADHLFVFQRTPQFTLPARHGTVDKAFLNDVKKNYDTIIEQAKHSPGGQPYKASGRSALSVSDEERNRIFEEAWERGGFRMVTETFEDLSTSRLANDTVSEFIRAKIRQTVKDPDVAEKLVPVDHPFTSKRPLIDTNYFETYNRDNVTLVDIRHAPIVEITPTGIRTEDAEYALDVIVFATGFDAVTGAFNKVDIEGRNGVKLKDKWADGPLTYLGLAIPGFPNLFTITGPGSPAVLANVPVAIEQHVEWITDLIRFMRDDDLDVVEATETAAQEWTALVGKLAERTIYMLADSWYSGANTPGKPVVFMMYPAGFNTYRDECDAIAADSYRGFAVSRAGQPAAPRESVGLH